MENGQTTGSGFTLQYQPGEFHVYTDQRLPLPDLSVITDKNEIKEEEKTPISFAYPNPFNKEVTICYNLLKDETVIIKIYDKLGKEVNTIYSDKKPAGIHYINWNGTNYSGTKVPDGYYFYKIISKEKSETGKILFSHE